MRERKLVDGGLLVLGAIGSVATLLGIVAVVSRYVIDLPLSFSDEVVTYLIVWAFLLGVGLGEAENSHIRATILLDAVRPSWRRVMVTISILTTIGFALLIVWYGTVIVHQRFLLGEVSPTMLRFPQWIARLCIPIGFALVLIAALRNLAVFLRRRVSEHR